MGIRAMFQNRQGLAAAIGGALIVGAASYLYLELGSSDASAAVPSKTFVTIDDGKTFTAAPGDSLGPFTLDGKTAYTAYVFTCNGGKTKFVGYMERYSDRAKAVVLEMRKQQQQSGGRARPSLRPEMLDGVEVKRPGEKDWIKHADVSRAGAVMDVRCPDAPDQRADLVLP
jgi:hypothetical protein